MSNTRQDFNFTGLSDDPETNNERSRRLNDLINDKVNSAVPTFLPPAYRESLMTALKEQLCASIEIRNHHEELALIWAKLHKELGNKMAENPDHFNSLMRNDNVQTLFQVIMNLAEGQDTYHTDDHSGEMRTDDPVDLEDQPPAVKLLINELKGKACGDHDIIQGDPIPIQNEVKSAAISEAGTTDLLTQLKLKALSKTEIEKLSKALAQPIIDHTFLILGKDSLASLRQEIEKSFFTPKEFKTRNKNLYFQNAIGYSMEFSDVNRSSYSPLVQTNSSYQKHLSSLANTVRPNETKLRSFAGGQTLSPSPTVNMLVGQGIRMLPEMHNKFRYDPSQPGKAELNLGTRLNVAKSILTTAGLSSEDLAAFIDKINKTQDPKIKSEAINDLFKNKPLLTDLKPLTEKLIVKGINAEILRVEVTQLAAKHKELAAIKPWAHVFTIPQEQAAMKDMIHNLKMFDLTGLTKYKDKYNELLDTHGATLAKVYVTSALHTFGSNDVGFSLDRDINKLMNNAAEVGVKLGSSEKPIDPLAHYKQAILLDKNTALSELTKKAADTKRSPEERQQLQTLIAQAANVTDLKTYYSEKIQGKPDENAKSFFHQMMVHAACQQGFYTQQQFISENLVQVKKELAGKRADLRIRQPQKLELLETMVKQAEVKLTASRESRVKAQVGAVEHIKKPITPPTGMGVRLSHAKSAKIYPAELLEREKIQRSVLKHKS